MALLAWLLPSAYSLQLDSSSLLGVRLGEADHPRPNVTFGTSNPSGLRGKEAVVMVSLPEVFCLSEKQLSAVCVSQRKSCLRRRKCPLTKLFKRLASGAA